jgi:hypothetical protein
MGFAELYSSYNYREESTMQHHLISLVLALSAGELVHNFIESQQVRKKVMWLRLVLAGKQYHDSFPIEVDSRAKSYGLSLVGLVVTTAIFYIGFSLFTISINTALIFVTALLVASYVVVAVVLDKYHVEIGTLTDSAQKQKS